MAKGAPINSLEHQKAIDLQIQEAFSDFVKKDRRNLLFLSALSGFLAVAKITPSEVNALGFKISNLKPNFIYGSLLVLTIYYFVAFWLHADPEYRKAREKMRESFRSLNEYLTPPLIQKVTHTVEVRWRYVFWTAFDYWGPIIVGFTAIAVIIFRMCRPA